MYQRVIYSEDFIPVFQVDYPDGTETQRVGIVPDVWIEPSIKGIREGRNELLAMVIEIINNEK